MTRLIIARHGNTFHKGETPTRIGAKTDLPLVPSGISQAKRIGVYCKDNNITPDVIFSGELKRANQTAENAFPGKAIKTLALFNEINYGPDENKSEADVIARIGQKAIDLWNSNAVVPPNWEVNPEEIIQGWQDFAKMIKNQYKDKTILVVTSNGIARFAPYITGDFNRFVQSHDIKLKTGALGIFDLENNAWQVSEWNLVPTIS